MMSLLEKPGDGEKPLWDQLARLGIGSEKNSTSRLCLPRFKTL